MNLMNKLWYVLSISEENSPDEIVISKDSRYAIGRSEILGAFQTKREAKLFAAGAQLQQVREVHTE